MDKYFRVSCAFRTCFIASLAGLPWIGAAMGGEFQASAGVEAGWTSNAEQDLDGRPDLFVIVTRSAAFVHAEQGLALRGSLRLEDVRYRRAFEENDETIEADLAFERALGEAWVLSGAVSAAILQQGEALDLGDLRLGARTSGLDGDAGLELTGRFGATQLRGGLGLKGRWHGETHLVGLPVSLRLDPDVTASVASVLVSHGFAEGFTGLAALSYEATHVRAEETEAFGRMAADGLRLSLGAEFGFGEGLTLAGRGGVALVTPSGGRAGPRFTVPLGEAAARLALGPVVLDMSALADVELTDPVDGYAGQVVQAEARLGLNTGGPVGVHAHARHRRERGLDLPVFVAEETELGVGADYTPTPGVRFSGRIGRIRTATDGPAVEETRLSLGVTGTI